MNKSAPSHHLPMTIFNCPKLFEAAILWNMYLYVNDMVAFVCMDAYYWHYMCSSHVSIISFTWHDESTSNLVHHADSCNPVDSSSTQAITSFVHGSLYTPQKLHLKLPYGLLDTIACTPSLPILNSGEWQCAANVHVCHFCDTNVNIDLILYILIRNKSQKYLQLY